MKSTTRKLCPILFALALASSTLAQTAPVPSTATTPAPTAPAPTATALTPTTALPSATLKPALDSIPQTIALLRPEKWKISGPMKQETQANLTSIQSDIKTTLPPLLAAADQHPDSVAQVLPALSNISALYDVLLRVAQVAMISAPAPQSTALQQNVASFEKARRELGDNLQITALAQSQQTRDLQAQLQTLQATPPPAPVVCPAPPAAAPAKKRKPKPKPAAATVTP